jgi:predicted secreted protein
MDRKKFIKGLSCLPVAATLLSFTGVKPEHSKYKYCRPNQGYIPKFDDARSKKVILLVHCFLNQSARIDKYASFPAVISPVIQELLKRGIGMVQLPCPETQILSLARDGNIYKLLSEPDARNELKTYADQVLELVHEYQKWDFKVLGLLGNDGSPCCGVNNHYDEGQKPGPGVFIQELKSALAECNPAIQMVGITDITTEEAIKAIDKWDKA